MKRTKLTSGLAVLMMLAATVFSAAAWATDPKGATDKTRQLNTQLAKTLNWADQDDLAGAQRGLIATDPKLTITTDLGKTVWDLNQYSFLNGEAAGPETINPSLWRNARLNLASGLFKVADHIYQVRGYDLGNVTFVEGETGYIVIDPLTSLETAKAALELLYKHVGQKPVVAVIYTHSHIDHWAGVKGIISEEEVKTGKVKIIASQGFLEEAVSENVMAGNAMTRRAAYMYGNLLPKGPQGQVDAGLGKTVASGTVTIIAPNDIINKTGETRVIDGVKIVFQYTPNTEAPTEMNFYFPQYKALCIAENCTHTLHNLYTLRGAKVRDAKAWAFFLNETIDLFGAKSEVMFASHHWPCWGSGEVMSMLGKQRDAYKFIHDQTLRLANEGLNMTEIAEKIKLPDTLAKAWYNRGYYGSVSHDSKAVFQRYLGWFDGNPANLDPLPPVEASKRYVEFMGGSRAVLSKAKKYFAKGEYRWVAQVMNHVVFAEPKNQEAKELEADALEQLGYQAESGPWRNFFLTGALELRQGIVRIPGQSGSSDVIKAMPLDMIFDLMAVHLNGQKAAGKKISVNWKFTDTGEKYLLTVENSVLNYFKGKVSPKADVTVTLTRPILNEVLAGTTNFKAKVASREIKIKGNPLKLIGLMELQDKFDPNFKIVDR